MCAMALVYDETRMQADMWGVGALAPTEKKPTCVH